MLWLDGIFDNCRCRTDGMVVSLLNSKTYNNYKYRIYDDEKDLYKSVSFTELLMMRKEVIGIELIYDGNYWTFIGVDTTDTAWYALVPYDKNSRYILNSIEFVSENYRFEETRGIDSTKLLSEIRDFEQEVPKGLIYQDTKGHLHNIGSLIAKSFARNNKVEIKVINGNQLEVKYQRGKVNKMVLWQTDNTMSVDNGYWTIVYDITNPKLVGFLSKLKMAERG